MPLLDRPVWSSLSTMHAHLSLGNELARCYRIDINRFASASDDSATSLQALAALIGIDDEAVYILQVPRIIMPDELYASMTSTGVQMVADKLLHADNSTSHVITVLTEDDAEDMMALATLTEPGPFLRHTGRMGRFVGIRIHGQLAAMAGERFRFPGYTEVSGVCTHPDFRGQGLAQALSCHVAAHICARGDTPFLHAWISNKAAIRLYEKLGFRTRCEVNVAILKRRAGDKNRPTGRSL